MAIGAAENYANSECTSQGLVSGEIQRRGKSTKLPSWRNFITTRIVCAPWRHSLWTFLIIQLARPEKQTFFSLENGGIEALSSDWWAVELDPEFLLLLILKVEKKYSTRFSSFRHILKIGGNTAFLTVQIFAWLVYLTFV